MRYSSLTKPCNYPGKQPSITPIDWLKAGSCNPGHVYAGPSLPWGLFFHSIPRGMEVPRGGLSSSWYRALGHAVFFFFFVGPGNPVHTPNSSRGMHSVNRLL